MLFEQNAHKVRRLRCGRKPDFSLTYGTTFWSNLTPCADVVKRLKIESLKMHKITVYFLNLFWLKFQRKKEFYGRNTWFVPKVSVLIFLCTNWQRSTSLMYRVIHKSLRDFRTRLRNNQERHDRQKAYQ